jgi:glutamate/aspartate transport system ATP-binding protein
VVIVIEICNVCKFFGTGTFQVLKGCTASVAKGEVIAVGDRSGSGKSTLTKCVNGLGTFDSGEIFVQGISDGARSTDLPRLRAKVGMVFRHFKLFPHLTVLEDLTLANARCLPHSRRGEPKRAGPSRAFRPSDQAGRFPSPLFDSQQQRVAIARALAIDPIVMLFDEPTSALDPEMISEVIEVIRAHTRRHYDLRHPWDGLCEAGRRPSDLHGPRRDRRGRFDQ